MIPPRGRIRRPRRGRGPAVAHFQSSDRSRLARRGAVQLCCQAGVGAVGRAATELSLEELANIEVTSVSKTSEPLSDAPAAIYVITHDDIMRSGATTIPEMLRLAPNLQVAQTSASSYAITARGFNGQRCEHLQQAAGADRRAQRLHAAVLRRLLGHAGRAARGHRPHRGDQRAGRDAVGRQRRQRRHQHHHAQVRRDPGRRWSRSAPATSNGAARPAVWRPDRRRPHLSRLCRRLPFQPDPRDRWRRRRGRLVAAAGRLPRRLDPRKRSAHGRRRYFSGIGRARRLDPGARSRRYLAASLRQQLVAAGAGLLRPGQALHRQRRRRVPRRHLRSERPASIQSRYAGTSSSGAPRIASSPTRSRTRRRCCSSRRAARSTSRTSLSRTRSPSRRR